MPRRWEWVDGMMWVLMNLWNSNGSAGMRCEVGWDKASEDGDGGGGDVSWCSLAARGANGPGEGRTNRMLDGSCYALNHIQRAQKRKASYSDESASHFSKTSCLQRDCGGRSSWWVAVMNWESGLSTGRINTNHGSDSNHSREVRIRLPKRTINTSDLDTAYAFASFVW